MRRAGALGITLSILVAACGSTAHEVATKSGTASTTAPPQPSALATVIPAAPVTSEASPAPSAPRATTTTTLPTPMTVAYRLERRTADDATAGFESIARETLLDRRGWTRAGFDFVEDSSAPYLIVLAEGDEVDRLCRPYDTYGRYSCQNGPVVALNADRWRTADPKWTGDLPTYRQMLINHEVGHLLGQSHPKPQCPRRGEPAPVMNQQSTELNGCLPNPWPLDWEVALAARHDRPLAPGPEASRR